MRTHQKLDKGSWITPKSGGYPGSVLIFPFYCFNSSNLGNENTQFTINNTYSSSVIVDLVFVSQDMEITTVNRTIAAGTSLVFLASDLAPANVGYLMVVAKDSSGYPVKRNYLNGTQHIYLASGHSASPSAFQIPRISEFVPPTPKSGDPTLPVITIKPLFDGINYAFLPYDTYTTIKQPDIVALTGVYGDVVGGFLSEEIFWGVNGNLKNTQGRFATISNLFPKKALYYGTLEELFPNTRTKIQTFWSEGSVTAVFQPSMSSNIFSTILSEG
jgi:hypothetical protein